MNWLLTLVLLTSIISWYITHNYQEKIIELEKKYQKELQDYQVELYQAYDKILDLENKLKGRIQL